MNSIQVTALGQGYLTYRHIIYIAGLSYLADYCHIMKYEPLRLCFKRKFAIHHDVLVPGVQGGVCNLSHAPAYNVSLTAGGVGYLDIASATATAAAANAIPRV